MKSHQSAFLLLLSFLVSCGGNKQDSGQSGSTGIDSSVVQTAKEAYIFGLPLVLMDLTRRKMTDGSSKDAAAENSFFNKSEFPDASFRDVVRPNADTYYSTASLDLSGGPVVLSVPNTHGRYHMMPMLDAYTNVFASPGTRTTGNGPNHFLITGPGWQGAVPADMQQIKAPTDMVWIIGRTQVNSKADGEKVVIPLQKQYKLTPWSSWGKPYTPSSPVADTALPKEGPNQIVKAMPIDEFLNYVNRLMVSNPPSAADKPAMDRFATIGVKPGGQFDLGKFDTATQRALKQTPEAFFNGVDSYLAKPKGLKNGWSTLSNNVGNYGTDYASRALVAYGGLGANLPQDAVYPSASQDADGNPLNGANNYVIHFDKGKTPPANAFWSLTMYDADGYMVDNPIKRNAIGDRSNLKKNADGSIDIYIQHVSPGKDKEQNWLPAPAGVFNVLLRVYWPKEEMIRGAWQAPPVKKLS